MTQLRPASDRASSSWIFGRATIATVLSMVASNCMPPIAVTAAKKRGDGSQLGTYLLVFARAAGSRRIGTARSELLAVVRAASLRAVIPSYPTVILRGV